MRNISNHYNIELFIMIVDRGKAEKVAEHLAQIGASMNFVFLGKGTASTKILTYLGLGSTEKDILFSFVPHNILKKILIHLDSELFLNKPGRGIAFSVKINDLLSITGKKKSEESEEITMTNSAYKLVIAITEQGSVEEIMNSAREAGATGGTIVHAKGAGAKEAEKFFGISIQAERQMLFIVAENDIADAVLIAIDRKGKEQKETKTMVFSLPVTAVAGLNNSQE